jgi:hypothetical protein
MSDYPPAGYQPRRFISGIYPKLFAFDEFSTGRTNFYVRSYTKLSSYSGGD